jgi:hypothetical protein
MNKKIINTITGGVLTEEFNNTDDVDVFNFDFDNNDGWFYNNKLVDILEINKDGTVKIQYDSHTMGEEPFDVEPAELMEVPEF